MLFTHLHYDISKGIYMINKNQYDCNKNFIELSSEKNTKIRKRHYIKLAICVRERKERERTKKKTKEFFIYFIFKYLKTTFCMTFNKIFNRISVYIFTYNIYI